MIDPKKIIRVGDVSPDPVPPTKPGPPPMPPHAQGNIGPLITNLLKEQERLSSFWSSVMMILENTKKSCDALTSISDLQQTLIAVSVRLVINRLNVLPEEFAQTWKEVAQVDIDQELLKVLFDKQ